MSKRSGCSDADVQFARCLGTLVDKTNGVVGQYCGWGERQFLSIRAARARPKAAARVRPKAAARRKPKASGKRRDESDGDEIEGGDESERASSEEDEDGNETLPPPPPAKGLARTNMVKRGGNRKHRGKTTPPPPPTIEPTSQEGVKRVVGRKGKGRAAPSAAPEATLRPSPTVELKSQEGRDKRVADRKAKGPEMPSAVPKASDPHIEEPQTSRSARSARRKQGAPTGPDEMETEDQPPPSGAATETGPFMLTDSFKNELDSVEDIPYPTKQEWVDVMCERVRQHAFGNRR